MEGSNSGTTLCGDKTDPKIFGEVNEANIEINHIRTTALLDTGSCVSIISKAFYDENFSQINIQPLNEIIHIECADGNTLPYVGYI